LSARVSVGVLLAFGAAALGLFGALYALAALVLYALGRGLGGKADFARAAQAAAALALLAPVQAACSAFAYAWVVPTALGAWVAAGALEGFFGAPVLAARGLCAVFAAAAIGAQFLARTAAEQALATANAVRSVAQTAAVTAELSRQMQALPGAASAGAVPGPAPNAAPAAVSGLDLLRAPDDAGGTPPPPASAAASAGAQAAAATASMQGMQQSALGMLDAMQPMLSNPAMTAKMNPQQKAQFKQIMTMMADLRSQINSGKPLSPAEQSQQMMRIQSLTMSLMSSGLQLPPMPAPAPAPAPAPKPASGGAP